MQELLDFSLLSSDETAELLRKYRLQLSVDEALFIQTQLLKRPPTYAECVLWSIQGSEHCSYKSSRKYLRRLMSTAPQVILGPSEDAGIVAVATDREGYRYGIVVSHESHNHPSQLVPYEGAATGVGGNVRDVACMGAEVIAVADGLRFGDIQHKQTKWIHEGVVRGIAGYANPLGIPNLAGDLYYDAAYNDNCLVTVVSLGLVREDQVLHSRTPAHGVGFKLILVGKPTDNSGFGGAAFASANLDAVHQEANKGAIQEPNAFLQRHILKASYALFDYLRANKLIDEVGFKDLGAGGIACASVELADAAGFGANIWLERVPTSMPDLPPAVILCSETQERFMWVAPDYLVDTILTHYNQRFALADICEGALATVVGEIRADGEYVVSFEDEVIVSAKAKDITRGIVYDRPYVLPEPSPSPPIIHQDDLAAQLLALLAHENIASRAPVYECYDKQVQGRVVLERGQAQAGVLAPFSEDKYPEEIRHTGVALSLAHNPNECRLDPYQGAMNAVIEAASQVVAVGAWPVALTDCLCFGNPEIPEQMGVFVASIQGLVDGCQAIKHLDDPKVSLPIIAGNVSFYNQTEHTVIPPSPLVSCIGRMDDFRKAMTPDLKQAGSLLYVISSSPHVIPSEARDLPQAGTDLPSEVSRFARDDVRELLAVHTLIDKGLVLAVRAITSGGIAICLAKMSFKHQIGIEASLPSLFAERGGFVLEVDPTVADAVNSLLAEHAVSYQQVGKTMAEPTLKINGTLALPLSEAAAAFDRGLRERLT